MFIYIYFTLGRQNECIILLENALWWDTHGITECMSSQSLGNSSWELWELGIDMTKALWLMVLKGPIIRHQTSTVLVCQLFCPFVCGVTCTLSWKLGKPWVTQSTVYRLSPFYVLEVPDSFVYREYQMAEMFITQLTAANIYHFLQVKNCFKLQVYRGL